MHDAIEEPAPPASSPMHDEPAADVEPADAPPPPAYEPIDDDDEGPPDSPAVQPRRKRRTQAENRCPRHASTEALAL
eukprot:1523804-Prymnesium_polylepis.1